MWLDDSAHLLNFGHGFSVEWWVASGGSVGRCSNVKNISVERFLLLLRRSDVKKNSGSVR
jgi:hypothetical protein